MGECLLEKSVPGCYLTKRMQAFPFSDGGPGSSFETSPGAPDWGDKEPTHVGYFKFYEGRMGQMDWILSKGGGLLIPLFVVSFCCQDWATITESCVINHLDRIIPLLPASMRALGESISQA